MSHYPRNRWKDWWIFTSVSLGRHREIMTYLWFSPPSNSAKYSLSAKQKWNEVHVPVFCFELLEVIGRFDYSHGLIFISKAWTFWPHWMLHKMAIAKGWMGGWVDDPGLGELRTWAVCSFLPFREEEKKIFLLFSFWFRWLVSLLLWPWFL